MLDHAIAFTLGITWGLIIIALCKYIFSKTKHQKDINASATTKTPSKPFFKPSKQEETEEERKYNAILDNIDNYDGTGKNQKEVR